MADRSKMFITAEELRSLTHKLRCAKLAEIKLRMDRPPKRFELYCLIIGTALATILAIK